MDKKQMTEEEIKLNFITPSITDKWDKTSIRMEFYFTNGRISVDGKKARRGEANKADYLLYHGDISNNNPIAVVEAKDNKHTVLSGLPQAVNYATILNVPFAFSSNGDSFAFHDMLTGEEKTDIPLSEFPSPEELWQKYLTESGLSEKEERILSVPYYYREGDHEPRYYQWIAINRVLSAVARGEKRMLIVLATGTGKTLVSFQIIWRLLQAGIIKRALFLADRDILIGQPMRDDFAPLAKKMYRIEKREMDTAHQVYFSLYHQMKDGESNYYTAYDRDFFDLVIVDECHRGSADEDSSWHEILEYFDSAIQIGMTATPKETKDTSNIEYFGGNEPIYTYSLKQGIEDGFLAPYKVVRVNLDIDINGYRPFPGMLDLNGEPLEDKVYEQKDFDRILVVKERTEKVAKRITEFLKENDRYAKTIVFCEDIDHAERMRLALVNENKDLIVDEPHYVAQITSGSDEKGLIDDFTDPYEKYPVIAVTSRLMSTGVNSQTCKLVVLDRTVGSMTEFKQIIGRGTRVREDCDKLFFTIMDFRKNHVKFADPSFDGTPVKIKDVGENESFGEDSTEENSNTDEQNANERGIGNREPQVKEKTTKKKKYIINGVDVNIVNEKVEYLDSNGKLITESIIDYSRANLLRLYPYYEEFRNGWLEERKKKELLEKLVEDGVFINYIKDTIPDPDDNIDEYDVLSYVGYSKKPLTKDQRIEHVIVSGFLNNYSNDNQRIIRLLLEAYRNRNIDELSNFRILNLPEFSDINSPVTIVNGFGGKKSYINMISDIEREIYYSA